MSKTSIVAANDAKVLSNVVAVGEDYFSPSSIEEINLNDAGKDLQMVVKYDDPLEQDRILQKNFMITFDDEKDTDEFVTRVSSFAKKYAIPILATAVAIGVFSMLTRSEAGDWKK